MAQAKAQTATLWQLEEVPCDFCGDHDADLLLTGRDRLHGRPGEFHIVLCRRCRLARTSPRPTADTLGAAYPAEYEPYQEARISPRPPRGLRRWALVNLRSYPLGRRAPPALVAALRPFAALDLRRRRALGYLPYVGEGRLLDFGCGAGRYVARMKAAGWKAEGLDLSPQAVNAGRAAGLTVHQGTLPGADLPPASFDAITMWHALEHVPGPLATLRAAAQLLRPGGLLLVAVPRLDSLPARWFGSAWYGLDLPRHLTHFTAATLRRHLETAGFQVDRLVQVRRPGFLRHSFALLADDTGRPLHRRLSRSRLVAGLLSWISLLAGRTQQMVALAHRP